jgi:8-oxo-dGTP diphosphatase
LNTEQSPIAREYPSAPLIGVGGLVIDGDRVLLVKRKNPPAQGEWSIPGGLAHLGETLKEAVAREVLEETGLTVTVGDLVELLERIFHDASGRVKYHYVIADYYCRVTGGNLESGSDALEAAWAQRKNLAEYGLADITLQVVEKALDYQDNSQASDFRQ